MKKQVLGLALLAALLIALCVGTIATQGRTLTVDLDVGQKAASAEACEVTLSDEGIVEITDRQLRDGTLSVTVTSLKKGHTLIIASLPGDEYHYSKSIHVHPSGLITEGNYFGHCTGDRIIPVAIAVFLLALLAVLIWNYRRDTRQNLYQYRNVRNLGIIIFLAFLLISDVLRIFSYRGLTESIRSLMNATGRFAYIALPLFLIVSILVTLSNVQLLRREGRTWRNLLGTFLGLLLIVGTLFPFFLGEYLQRSTVFDVHNEQGLALYVENLVETGIFSIIAYLECILLATILIGLQAARHIPAFDKDYILILGCKVLKDGSLTKLLQGRADRAVEFAKMQKESSGKDVVFVPSGGQGSDEVIAEADAIHNYLVSIGIPEEQILVENRSSNTFENFKYSMELIRAHSQSPDPKIAFSTTNYHVFRSGMYATKQGFSAEGIGAPTKRYFWVNAFIREFIATLRYEWKAHLPISLTLVLISFLMVLVTWFSNNI